METVAQDCAVAQKTRIVVVEDHELFRHALKSLLESQAGLEVCDEADEALHLVNTHRPELVVVDLSLKQGDGLDLIRRIHERFPAISIIVLSMYDSKLFAERALRAGARGYIHKQQPTRDIMTAIRTVLDGDVYLDSEMTREVLRRSAQNGEPLLSRSPVDCLSDRELEIFRFLGRGMTTRQIATELHLATSTVETYRERLKVKLNAHTGADLTRQAIQWVLENG